MPNYNLIFFVYFLFRYLKATMRRAGRADFLSAAASIDTGINSVLTMSTSRDNRQGSGITKGAKSTLAFTIESCQFVSKVILASQASVRETFRTENWKIKFLSTWIKFSNFLNRGVFLRYISIRNRNLRFQLVVLWGWVVSLGNSHDSEENNDGLWNWNRF